MWMVRGIDPVGRVVTKLVTTMSEAISLAEWMRSQKMNVSLWHDDGSNWSEHPSDSENLS